MRHVSRWLTLASMLALGVVAPGCAEREAPQSDVSDDSITEVDQTDVKRQSIGNCWIYATTSWLEALHKGAAGEEVDTSESWLTYWHWYEQIVTSSFRSELSTGGWYWTAARLVERYGLMKEADFVPSDANAEMSKRQEMALSKVNAALKTGALSKPELRRDRALVRRELDRAWGLDAAQSARMDAVFGTSAERTLDASPEANAAAAANKVIRAADFEARLVDPQTNKPYVATLADAIGTSAGTSRKGPSAFNTVRYPSTKTDRRAFWKRVQRALHDQVPVITFWKVDFNALTRDARFSKDELDKRGPGKQGGHLTVMHDYEAEVPGLGLLEAGKQATPEEMDRALSNDTTIKFVRVKNSWGGIRPDRWSEAAIAGYHDLELPYLDGPIKECEVDAKGETDTKNCNGKVTPLWDVVLPPGY